MPFALQYLAGPAIGAVIGYITNDIAIRMLFRPHRAKYILGVHVPFTPGIIPKERERIAEAVGDAISENLMNRETLERNLLSPEMLGKIGLTFDEFVGRQQHNDESVEQMAAHYLSTEEIKAVKDDIREELTLLINREMEYSNFGDRVADMVMEHTTKKMNSGLAGLLGADRFVELIREPARRTLSKQVNEMLKKQAPHIVADLIGKETEQVASMPMKTLLEGKTDKVAQARTSLLSIYTTIISDHLPRILQTLDISVIIRDRINEMDMNEAENIILNVMRTELRAIVWLGALLGFIMGFVNMFIQMWSTS